MRAVEMILGGAIVVVLVLGVAAVLTDGTGPPGDGDDDVVDQTEPEGGDAGGQPDERDVVVEPDGSDTEGAPGSESTTPEPAQPPDPASPGPAQDQTGPQPDGEGSKVALDEPEQPGIAEPSRTLPNTGGAVPAVIGLGLLAASGLVGLLRLRMGR